MTMKRAIVSIILSVCICLTAASDNLSTDSIDALCDSISMMNLDVVTVTARRPEAVVTAEKISYTPAATLSGSGGNIYDTLSSLPGVTADSKGSISVNGQQGVGITIDGRKSILSGDALHNYLKSLPSANVDRIEIISAPSARQDASGTATVINIRMKRVSDEGFALGLNGDGRMWKARRGLGNLFAGYTRGSHRLSLTYASMAARYPSVLTTDRPYADTHRRMVQHYDRRRKDLMHNASLSYDCRNSRAFTFGASLAANLYTRREHAVMNTTVPSADIPVVTDNNTRFHTRNIFGNLYMRHTAARPESDVTLNLDFFNYRNSERQSMTDNMDTDIDGDMGGTTAGYVGALDFRHTLSGHWHISGGLRCSYVTMDNDGRYSGQTSAADALGSDFKYSENVNAAYGEGRARYGRLTATMGLRIEQTNLSTVFSGNEATARTDYSDHAAQLFPSVSLSLDAGGGNNAALSYTKRITRPRYADLNPFIHIFDDITHVGGNIGLRPAVSHNVRAAWSHGSWLRVTMTATYTDNDIAKCYREISERLVYVSPENLPRRIGLSLNVAGVNIHVTKWWRLSASGSLLYANYHFPKATGIAANCLFTPMADIKNLFDFPHGWSAELSGSFRGPAAYGQARVSASGNLYIGLRKSILGSRGNVTLYIRDLLNTNHSTSTIYLAGKCATIIEREYEDMRLAGVSFALRFNAGKPHKHIPAKNNWTDEMNRVNL